MTRVVDQLGGVNLAQGMPNFPPPPELIEAAHRAIDGDFHQYAITWGTPRLRQAIAEKYRKVYRMDVEPDRHVTICCGSTETMLSTLLAVLNPGDEVIIFEPFYENYGPGCIISGAQPSFVPLEPPDFTFDPDRLRRAVTPANAARSSSTARTIRPGKSSRGKSSRSSPTSASSTTCWRSPTRSTSTSSTTAWVTRRSPRCRGWPSARSPSPASRSRTR